MSIGTSIDTQVGASYIECDKCRAHLSWYIMGSPAECAFKNREMYREAAADGWTFWASRSLRTYCPKCEPNKGHRMTDVTNGWANL